MNAAAKREFEQWLKGRPQVVQDLARKYPPMTRLLTDDGLHYVMGYATDGCLLVTFWNPAQHYEKGRAEGFHFNPQRGQRCDPDHCHICGRPLSERPECAPAPSPE